MNPKNRREREESAPGTDDSRRCGCDPHCILYCGSALGEGCPSGFTCRDWDTGAPNPQQGACVPNRPPSEPDCDDGQDEDADGLTDCDDPDCENLPVCVPDEICDNTSDDDSDGAADCADPDCEGLPCDGGTCSGGVCQ